MIKPNELAWLVGLFEGEGCIGLSHQGRPTLQIGMTDEDVVRRAHTIAGVGRVRESAKLTLGGKRMWVWCAGRCDEAAALLELMLPHLCKRRAARAREVLASYEAAPPPKRLRTHCIYGHPLSGENLGIERIYGRVKGRRCRTCAVRRTQECRDRNPGRAREQLRASRARRKLREAAA